MIYICEKCNMVFRAEFILTECECCGCTYIRKADGREIADVVGSLLLNSDENVLIKDKK